MKLSEWREVLDIISDHSPFGEEETDIFRPEHDEIYLNLDVEEVPEESIDGQRLIDLGFHISNDAWLRFV